MTQHESDASHDQHYQEVMELLPWYVNGTLQEAELKTVERYLAQSPAMQAELIRWHNIATAVQLDAEPSPPLSPEAFATLMAQINAAEANPSKRSTGGQRSTTNRS